MGNSVLRVLGFGALGPTKNSVASCWQSCLGNVPKGHCFGGYQRIGMGESSCCCCCPCLGNLLKWILKWVFILGLAYLVYWLFLQDTVEPWVKEVFIPWFQNDAVPWLQNIALPWLRDIANKLYDFFRLLYLYFVEAADKIYEWFRSLYSDSVKGLSNTVQGVKNETKLDVQ